VVCVYCVSDIWLTWWLSSTWPYSLFIGIRRNYLFSAFNDIDWLRIVYSSASDIQCAAGVCVCVCHGQPAGCVAGWPQLAGSGLWLACGQLAAIQPAAGLQPIGSLCNGLAWLIVVTGSQWRRQPLLLAGWPATSCNGLPASVVLMWLASLSAMSAFVICWLTANQWLFFPAGSCGVQQRPAYYSGVASPSLFSFS